jgi:signal peptidase I
MAVWMVRHVVWIAVVHGTSMQPSLPSGQRILVVSRRFRRPRRGDVVVIRAPVGAPRHLVKRVHGLAGDLALGAAELRDDDAGGVHATAGAARRVPADHLYVLGDSAGLDSSVFGPIPRHMVLGTAVLRLSRRPPTSDQEAIMSSSQPPPEHSPSIRPGQREPTAGRSASARYVLGFDTRCTTCSRTARLVRQASDSLLETQGLLDPEMRRWRRRPDGSDGPWRPTLAVVDGSDTRTFTGWRMALTLARRLGPGRALQVALAARVGLRRRRTGRGVAGRRGDDLRP